MGMKLAALSVNGFKRITVAEVAFDATESGVVALMGRNEAGKSSFLDALAALITPGRQIPKRTQPVHAGQDEAVIIGEFTDDSGATYKVTRRYVAATGKTSIVVEQDGLRVAKTETILGALYSHIGLDPLAFANLPSDKQVETLVRLTGFDPKPLDDKRANLYATRTAVGQDVRRLEGVVKSQPAEDASLADAELVVVADLAASLDAMRSRNRSRLHLDQQIMTFEEEVADLERRLSVARGRVASTTEDRLALGAEECEADLVATLAGAEARNDRIRAERERKRYVTDLGIEQDRYDLLTSQIEAVDEEKIARLAEADMPVEGLSIVDDEVYLDGTPFAETSSGRKFRTSVLIAIALNPTLRAIIIRDGSLIDGENRKIIDEIARKHDFLVLMEIVDENAPSGIVFEDGEISDRRGVTA